MPDTDNLISAQMEELNAEDVQILLNLLDKYSTLLSRECERLEGLLSAETTFFVRKRPALLKSTTYEFNTLTLSTMRLVRLIGQFYEYYVVYEHGDFSLGYRMQIELALSHAEARLARAQELLPHEVSSQLATRVERDAENGLSMRFHPSPPKTPA